MSTVEFLSKLRESNIQLRLEGEKLKYQAPKGVVTKEILSEISGRKGEIIAFLKQVSASNQEEAPIPRLERDEIGLPLSYTQQSMWFFDHYSKGNPVFNICNAMKMSGDLHKDLFIKALNYLVERHESLRTTFRNVDGRPLQVIHPAFPVEIPEIDLRAVPKEELDLKLKELLKKEARCSFDLEKGPLFKFTLFILGEHEYVFCMNMHHIISDAWANAIFFKEFLKLYEAYVKGEDVAFPELKIQYADYASWERKKFDEEMPKDLLDYWSKQLEKPTTLQLPLDNPRQKIKYNDGGYQPVIVSPDIADKLKEIGKSEGASFFMIVLAAFQTMFYRYSGQTDIFTGTVVANRNRKDVENIVGPFINTLVLRTNFDDDPTFIEVLRRVKKMNLDAFTYQEMPFDKMLEVLKPERDPSLTPYFQVMFIMQNTQKVELDLPGLKAEQIDVENDLALFDLRLQLYETEDGLKGGIEFDSRLYKPSTIKRMSEHLLNILEFVADNPQTKVADITMMTGEERRQILADFNNTDAPYSKDKVISEYFEEQAEKNPDTVAVIFENQDLTYGELNKKANQLARLLREKGVGQGSFVGIMLERSLEMIVGILAIEKAGGAYLPIDPRYPNERINYILEDSGAELLLSNKKFDDIELRKHVDKIFIEDESLYSGDSSNLPDKPDPHSVAYVIYTSGSTGKPKGAMIEQHSLINRLEWMQKKYPIGSDDTILQKTTFTFDVSVWEMFRWGMHGAKVCFLEPGAEKDPGKIVETIEKNHITVIHFVPSMLTAFLEHVKDTGEAQRISCLRQIFTSGEALTTAQVEMFSKLLSENGTKLANLYGPTEATIDVSYFDCDKDNCKNSVPIGKPIDNIKLYIMDNKMQLQPIGVPGELCIAGVGLARGYLNKPEMTAEKFVDNPFAPGEKLYRTGDLAKWREDGNIEYLGRLDFQVKIRGLRIELGEIENDILQHPSVKECIVNAWEKKAGDLHLVAYVVCESGEKVDSTELEKFLDNTLPDYMIPRIYVFLDTMPLSANGKADRKALPEPVLEKKTGYIAPSNDTENAIAQIWKEELGIDTVGVNDNFFEVGGHSLLLTKVHSRLIKQFNKDIPLLDLFSYTTISSLAKYISGSNDDESSHKNDDRLKKQKEAKMKKRQMHRR